jgi:peptidoglycan hydrolase-like protein with peptidoglycan-binding domain
MIRSVMIAACAVTLGAAWAVAPASAEDVKTKAERAGDTIEDKADRAGETIKDKAEGAKDTVERKTESAKDTIEDKAHRAKEKLSAKADRAQVRNAQQALRDKGHDPGPIDGVAGPRTRSAVRDFQKAQGITPTGRLDEATMAKLDMHASADDRTTPSASPGTTPLKRQNP